MKYCKNCGKEIEENQKFCNKCGTENKEGNYTTTIDTTGITKGNLRISFPASAGTLALTSQIPSNYVTTDTQQTISGAKTFTANYTTFNGTSGNTDPIYIEADEDCGIEFYDSDNAATTHLYPTNRSSGTANAVNIALPNTSGTLALASQIPSVPVTDVTVGGTSVVSSGTAVIPALFSGNYNDLSNKPTILGSSTETWTFTLSDGTTTTKTIVLG